MLSGETFQLEDRTMKWITKTVGFSLDLVKLGGFASYTYLLQVIATFCRPKAIFVGISMLLRFFMFHRSIENHRKTLNEKSKNDDFIYQFLEEQEKYKNNPEMKPKFSDNLHILALCYCHLTFPQALLRGTIPFSTDVLTSVPDSSGSHLNTFVRHFCQHIHKSFLATFRRSFLATFTNSQLKWILSDIFIAAVETSVAAIRWALVMASENPEIQQTLFDEIESVIGRVRKP
ncbi:hypothetical protein Anas_06050, partial [Armadillidium nasatum]